MRGHRPGPVEEGAGWPEGGASIAFGGVPPNEVTPLSRGPTSVVTLLPRIVASVLALSVVAAPVAAQDAALMVEVQGGVSVPFGDLRDGDAPGEGTSAGPSLQVELAFPSAGWRTLYVGFAQHRFGCEAAGCAADGRYVATGFNAGLRIVPVQGRLTPWIRLGGITTRVETGDLAATPGGAPDAGVSDLGFGGEAGVGFMVDLGRSTAWSVSALASTARTTLPGGSELDLRFFTAHTGITFVF